ncbi:MAG: PfkB family carbohydrate kinase [Pseudomonadota bacterium]
MNSANANEVARIEGQFAGDTRIAFVSGNFNVIHPGHLRLFEFAASCADVLVVGVHQDGYGNTILPAGLRLESVSGVSKIDHAFVLPGTPEDFIRDLKPAVVVKGKEHEERFNPELAAVDSYGGKLLFSSGDIRFSSLDLIAREFDEPGVGQIEKPTDYLARHQFELHELAPIVDDFRRLRVVVVGDLIVDEYITCDALGMSQEDPTLVVTPLKYDRFIGGAAIVAAHARGLGARVSYFGVTGVDETAEFAVKRMTEYGVDARFFADDSRPTTLKQRYRASDKTLLRVSHLRSHDISAELYAEMFEGLKEVLDGADVLMFSDFNYGCLPQGLVDQLVDHCTSRNIMMVADSQASSQLGDVSRFRGMQLVTPTEREARLATHDFSSGLVVLADSLRERAGVDNVIVTLAAEGILVHAPHSTTDALITDRLGAMNRAPKDVAGAGDSLLTCCSMALSVGASIWQAAYLGSIAAACQVSRVGNRPLEAGVLLEEIYR